MADWPVWLLAVIDALAVYRLTVLVTADIITLPARVSIIRWAYRNRAVGDRIGPIDRDDPNEDWDGAVDADMQENPGVAPRLAVLVRCQHCASVWLAAGAVAAHMFAPTLWLPIAAVLALSAATSLLASAED